MSAWPQYTFLTLMAVSFGINLAKHGEPKDAKYSIWIDLISTAIIVGILYYGGFFSVLGWHP